MICKEKHFLFFSNVKSVLVNSLLLVTVFSGCKKKDTDIDVAKRIVCLSPSSGEIICAVGGEDKIVARTDFCDFPSVMNKFPST